MFDGIEKLYIPLTDVKKLENFIEERCSNALFIERYGVQGWGDVSFLWLYVLQSERVLFYIEGISYWGGDIGLCKPIFFELSNYHKLNIEKMAAELSEFLRQSVTAETVKKIIKALAC